MDTQFIFWRLLPMPWWLVILTTISTYLLLSAVMRTVSSISTYILYLYSILSTTIQSLCHYKSPDSILLHLYPTTKGLRFIDPEKPLPPAHCRAQAALSSSTIQALINFLHKRIGQINIYNKLYHSFHCQANSNHRPKVNHNCTDSICAQLLFQFRILYLDHI